MTKKQYENEQRILKAIQQLKDSLFGMDMSYIDYCYYRGEDVCYLDNEKLESFASELFLNAKNTAMYRPEFESILPSFYKLVIKYIDKACPISDRRFVSIRKIAEVVNKPSADYRCPFDIMIDDLKEMFDLIFLSEYSEFSRKIVGIDHESFYRCVKGSVEAFIDSHNLNCLSNDLLTDQTVVKINQLAGRIRVDQRRRSLLIGDVTHDKT